MPKFQAGDEIENVDTGTVTEVLAVGNTRYFLRRTSGTCYGLEVAHDFDSIDLDYRKVEPRWQVGVTYQPSTTDVAWRYTATAVDPDGNALLALSEGGFTAARADERPNFAPVDDV